MDRKFKEEAGREKGKKGPVTCALQWQGLRRLGEKNSRKWGNGQWGLGDSQVRVGRGGGEVNADEAKTAKSLEGWQL